MEEKLSRESREDEINPATAKKKKRGTYQVSPNAY
jgi:hypothetical protein